MPCLVIKKCLKKTILDLHIDLNLPQETDPLFFGSRLNSSTCLWGIMPTKKVITKQDLKQMFLLTVTHHAHLPVLHLVFPLLFDGEMRWRSTAPSPCVQDWGGVEECSGPSSDPCRSEGYWEMEFHCRSGRFVAVRTQGKHCWSCPFWTNAQSKTKNVLCVHNWSSKSWFFLTVT